MSLWDRTGHGVTITGDGNYAVEYSFGKVVACIGPFDTEQKAENCRRRWGQNRLNARDRKLFLIGDVPDYPRRSAEDVQTTESAETSAA